jgi:hypothetical protein
MNKGTIGIAITERNRYGSFKKSYDQIVKYLPKGARLVVVDDFSDKPFKEATFRFETNVGIARGKNKCIELLEDCEHIFLFDSDTYPLCENWHLPYIESEHKHLMYIFKDFPSGPQLNDSVVEHQDENIIAYTHPRGCLLYIHNDCIKKVGGMRPEFGIWGIDHVELSERIHNAGLTKFRFMDVVGSEKLIHSMDEHRQVVTTVKSQQRAIELKKSFEVYEKIKGSSDFVPYKDKNLVLTCYFTTLIDPQRGTKWNYDGGATNDLYWSVPNGVDFRCLYDHSKLFELPMVSYKPKHENPYMAKWIAFRDYIITHPEYDNIALLDGTDTEILNNPFPHIDRDKLYCGDEPGTLNNQWLRNHHPHYIEFLNKNMRTPILNAGVIIGHRTLLLQFLDKMIERIPLDHSMTDMALYNYTLRTHFNDKIVSGRKVTTVFKAFDKVNRLGSWIKHK